MAPGTSQEVHGPFAPGKRPRHHGRRLLDGREGRRDSERASDHHRAARHGHDLRELRGTDGARPGQGRRRRQGGREPGDRAGDRDLRPSRRAHRRHRRRGRGRGLRGRDRTGDAAHPRHDLRELREPGGEGPAHAARRPPGRGQPRHREGHRHLPPRPGDPPGPGGRGARRRLRRRRAGAGRRRGSGRGGGRRRRGRPRRRLSHAQAQGGGRLRAQHLHLPGHDAAALVPVPARLDAQRLPPLGAGQHRAVLGGAAVLHHRLGSAEARHDDHEHAGRPGLVRGVHLQRARPSSRRSSNTRAWASPCTSTPRRSSSP